MREVKETLNELMVKNPQKELHIKGLSKKPKSDDYEIISEIKYVSLKDNRDGYYMIIDVEKSKNYLKNNKIMRQYIDEITFKEDIVLKLTEIKTDHEEVLEEVNDESSAEWKRKDGSIVSQKDYIKLHYNDEKNKDQGAKGIIPINNVLQEEYIFDKTQISRKIFHKDKAEIKTLYHFNYQQEIDKIRHSTNEKSLSQEDICSKLEKSFKQFIQNDLIT
ncbi:MAG: hypothetical protein U9532_00805 ['Conium maculatum' witches'-broom phytoplasma]|nr:hypothetical protein ['Conium maculatum' witches'-broom phytoplasma]